MAETYIVGETKVRPGAYFNIQKTGNNAAASIISGVTAVIFKSDFGPQRTDMQILSELAAQQTLCRKLSTAVQRQSLLVE